MLELGKLLKAVDYGITFCPLNEVPSSDIQRNLILFFYNGNIGRRRFEDIQRQNPQQAFSIVSRIINSQKTLLQNLYENSIYCNPKILYKYTAGVEGKEGEEYFEAFCLYFQEFFNCIKKHKYEVKKCCYRNAEQKVREYAQRRFPNETMRFEFCENHILRRLVPKGFEKLNKEKIEI